MVKKISDSLKFYPSLEIEILLYKLVTKFTAQPAMHLWIESQFAGRSFKMCSSVHPFAEQISRGALFHSIVRYRARPTRTNALVSSCWGTTRMATGRDNSRITPQEMMIGRNYLRRDPNIAGCTAVAMVISVVNWFQPSASELFLFISVFFARYWDFCMPFLDVF